MRKLAIVIAFALLLAACGGSDDEDATATTTAPVTADEAMNDDNMNDDNMDDEAMNDDNMNDDNMDDEAMNDEHMPTTFTVTVTNTSDGTALATPLAPGSYAVHTSMETLFAEGTEDRGEGLESLAEDGEPNTLTAALDALTTVSTAGSFAIPDDADEPGPALPGSGYSFTFEAVPGDYLSFATMFVQSNDWFFAPASSGINLFEDGIPLEGDITELIALWDAGTEVDESPGEGPNQAPRQAGPNTGDNQDAPITAVTGYDGAIAVTITVG